MMKPTLSSNTTSSINQSKLSALGEQVVTMWRIIKTEHVASCLAASGDKKRDKALKLWGLCPGVSQQGVLVLIPRSQVTGSCLGGGPSP